MLKTKNTPNEIKSLEDFTERALNFDFYTAMSDDHRVYLSGRRAHEMMDAYAAENPTAKKLWDFVKRENSEMFFVSQLMTRVEDSVLKDSKEAHAALRKFVLGYLVTSGAKSHIGASVRDAIGKHIGAPSAYIPGRKEEREKMIDDFIENPY